MKQLPKTITDIEALYFEYKKMEALMQLGVGIELPNHRHAPNSRVQNFVYSKLLIDLFAVVDKAIDVVFRKLKLKPAKKKSKLTILFEAGHVYNHPYLSWYREWRNDAAHHFKITEYHELRQASDGVEQQLVRWGFLKEGYKAVSYCSKISENDFEYGAIVNEIPVLLFEITLRNDGLNYKPLRDLSFRDYQDAFT